MNYSYMEEMMRLQNLHPPFSYFTEGEFPGVSLYDNFFTLPLGESVKQKKDDIRRIIRGCRFEMIFAQREASVLGKLIRGDDARKLTYDLFFCNKSENTLINSIFCISGNVDAFLQLLSIIHRDNNKIIIDRLDSKDFKSKNVKFICSRYSSHINSNNFTTRYNFFRDLYLNGGVKLCEESRGKKIVLLDYPEDHIQQLLPQKKIIQFRGEDLLCPILEKEKVQFVLKSWSKQASRNASSSNQ